MSETNLNKPREWYIERSIWIAYEPGTSDLDADAIHVREVLHNQITITREELRKTWEKWDMADTDKSSLEYVENELFGPNETKDEQK